MRLKQRIRLTVAMWLGRVELTGLNIRFPPGTRLVAHGPVTYVTAQVAGEGSRCAEFNDRPGWVLFVPER